MLMLGAHESVADERGETMPAPAPTDRLIKEVNWILHADQAHAERMAHGGVQPESAQSRMADGPRGLNAVAYPRDWQDRGAVDFLCKAGQLLVHDADLERVRQALAGSRTDVNVADSLFNGVTLLDVDAEVDDAINVIEAEHGTGVATPNHVLYVTPTGSPCPATEPDEPGSTEPWPALQKDDDGRGVRVAVVDTGFLQGWESRAQTPWLNGIEEYDIDMPDVLAPAGYIDPYAGHGTFVAGVVRCIAPQSEVTVDGVIQIAGAIDEASMVKQLVEALAKSPDVISFSAGTYTHNNVPPKAFTALWEKHLRHHKGVVLVAAAGNNESRQPFWPAAFPWAVSVGALTADGRERAEFSNHGGWVDAYAPGVDIVNAYCEGEYRLLLEPNVVRTFDGMCKWSGTSFSTPIVAGLIAARMSRTGENGRQAADALLEAARGQFLPGVGPRLLP